MMKPTTVEFGERYSDNSGWERLLTVDTHNDSVHIEATGSSMSCSIAELEWIIDAANNALIAIGVRGANNE